MSRNSRDTNLKEWQNSACCRTRVVEEKSIIHDIKTRTCYATCKVHNCQKWDEVTLTSFLDAKKVEMYYKRISNHPYKSADDNQYCAAQSNISGSFLQQGKIIALVCHSTAAVNRCEWTNVQMRVIIILKRFSSFSSAKMFPHEKYISFLYVCRY